MIKIRDKKHNFGKSVTDSYRGPGERGVDIEG